MKRIVIILCAGLGLLLADQRTHAFWGTAGYGGYQPWWNIFAKKPHMSEQEERLQRFWHDYYDSLKDYYGHLDHLDWVSYYKNHGYQINTGGPMGYMGRLAGGGGGGGGGGSNQRIQFAPVFIAPHFNGPCRKTLSRELPAVRRLLLHAPSRAEVMAPVAAMVR